MEISQKSVKHPSVVIEPPNGIFDVELKSLWQHRDLLYFLVWRDLKVRYKQTVIGIGWVVLQPLITMAIFTVIFGYYIKVPSDGYPYSLFVYCGLVIWNYFAAALNRSVVSVVADSHLISKVYFPRLILPLTGTISGMVDFAVSLVLLLVLLVWYGAPFTWRIFMIPGFLVFALLTALSVGLWLSALNVRFRDISHAIPFIVQVWMYATPVIYPISIIPEKYQWLYSLNPLVGVIEGFRWAMLGKTGPEIGTMVIGGSAVAVLLIGGLIFFHNMEQSFADVV